MEAYNSQRDKHGLFQAIIDEVYDQTDAGEYLDLNNES